MAPAGLHTELKIKHEDEHLPLQLSVLIQRDVLGGADGGPQAVCSQVVWLQQIKPTCSCVSWKFSHDFPYYITSYALTCISVKIMQEPKLPGYQNPSSQTLSITRGSKVGYEIMCPFSKLHLNWVKGSSAFQGWERWVLLPEMSLGLEGEKREDHAPYSASKVCFNYMTCQDSTFPMKYKNIQTLFVLYMNLLNLMIFSILSIALILGVLFFTKEKNRKSNNVSQMSFMATEK